MNQETLQPQGPLIEEVGSVALEEWDLTMEGGSAAEGGTARKTSIATTNRDTQNFDSNRMRPLPDRRLN
jgi:hypothetical protein